MLDYLLNIYRRIYNIIHPPPPLIPVNDLTPEEISAMRDSAIDRAMTIASEKLGIPEEDMEIRYIDVKGEQR